MLARALDLDPLFDHSIAEQSYHLLLQTVLVRTDVFPDENFLCSFDYDPNIKEPHRRCIAYILQQHNMSLSEKVEKQETNEFIEDRRPSYVSAHFVDGIGAPVIRDVDVEGRAVNPLLIFACIAFGASSFLFGFDNNVISPICKSKYFELF
jgi:hypothetical protein